MHAFFDLRAGSVFDLQDAPRALRLRFRGSMNDQRAHGQHASLLNQAFNGRGSGYAIENLFIA